MAKMKLIWHGGTMKNRFRAQATMALRLIGRLCVDTIKVSMGSSPSQPGDPPGVEDATYRRSIAYQVQPGRLVVRVGSNDARGPWLELGTGTRSKFGGDMIVITPVNAEILRFKVGGKTVFTKAVQHPGIHPRPHIVPGLTNSVPGIKTIVMKAMSL